MNAIYLIAYFLGGALGSLLGSVGWSLVGWNVAQAGLELPIKLKEFVGTSSVPCAPADVTVYFVPSGVYSHHISDPTPGTDRDEWWGGAKFTITF